MRPRILLIGLESQNREIDQVRLAFEAPSLFDYDVVICDVDSVLPLEWRHKIDRDEYIKVGEETGAWFRKGIEKLSKEARLLTEKGGILVCLMRPVRGMAWKSFDYSERRDIFHNEDNYNWIPIERLYSCISSGFGKVKKLCNEAGPFAGYIKMIETYWTAYAEGIDMLKVESRNIALNDVGKPIAFEIAHGKGSIVFLPVSEHANMADVLVDGAIALLKKTSERLAPQWIEKIKVPNEDNAMNSLDALAKKISEMQVKYDGILNSLEKKTEVKKLLYEKDEPLEETVKKAFEELGFVLTKKGDKDWIASSDVGEAILEVTGSEGSIDIDKLRQLLNYLMEENRGSDIEKKAVLVGNHFASTPLETRGEPFTEKVLKQAEVFSMCLMPTTELFNLIVKLREGKVEADDIRREILGTVSVFKRT